MKHDHSMKHDDIERRTLFGDVPDAVHARLTATLDGLTEEEPVKRKMKVRVALVALVILLLCGAAIAAVTWDVRAVLTRQDQQGNETINEELAQYAQPVGRVYEDGCLRIEVVDAIWDSRSLVAAWTVTNLTDEALYVVNQQAEGSIAWDAGAGSGGGDRGFIQPGGTINGMMDRRVYEEPDGDTVHVGIQYTALRVAMPYEVLELPSDYFAPDAPQRLEAYSNDFNRLLNEGYFIIEAQNGYWVIPSYYDELFNTTREEIMEETDGYFTEAEAMVRTGLFEEAATMLVAFDLKAEDAVRSLIPEGGTPEVDYGPFTMRVSLAELTPNTLEIIADVFFPDEAAARANTEVDEARFRLRMDVLALDENGAENWHSNASWGAAIREPIEQPDGRWMMQYAISHTEMPRIPETIEVCPRYIDADNNVVMPDGIVLDTQA